MADCSNVEIRELLPERAGGAVSAADTARVDAHLADCARCRSELELIQAARRVLRASPSIDLTRIASAVIDATARPSRPQLVTSAVRAAPESGRGQLRWVGWKAAAAIAIAAAGAGAFAVWSSVNESAPLPNGATVAVAQPAARLGNDPAPVCCAEPPVSPAAPVLIASVPRPALAPPELGLGGGLNDLSDGELQTLLGDLGPAGDVTPADASFEEPDVTEPSVGTMPEWESL